MKLWDKFINVDIAYSTPSSDGGFISTSTLQVHCPKTGRKPSISIDYSQVPGRVCYSITVKISNLYIEGLNAIWVNALDIELGYYAGGQTQSTKLHCSVFAGYTPQPGPDGYTVFEGIIGETETDSLTNQPYNFSLYMSEASKKDTTVAAVIDECCKQIGLTPHYYMEQGIQDQQFSQKDIPLNQFRSGYAVIQWLQEHLNNQGVSQEKPEDRFICTTIIFNRDVYFIAVGAKTQIKITETTKEARLASQKMRLPSLDLCTSVDWNAGTLNVTAPLVPDIQPGKLFTIDPKYYQGGKALPNSVAIAGTNRDAWNIYYVITQQVSFDTTGSTNQMKIMAVPMAVSPVNRDLGTQYKPQYDANALYEEFINKQGSKEIEGKDLTFGTKSKEQEKTEEKAKSVMDLQFSLSSSQMTKYIIKAGDCLSKIAGLQELNLPPLVAKLNGRTETVEGWQAWYPIILIATYTTYKSGKETHWACNPSQPDAIKTGNWLVIPALTWKDIQDKFKNQVVQIYETCSTYYKTLGNKFSWASSLDKCKLLIEKGCIQ